MKGKIYLMKKNIYNLIAIVVLSLAKVGLVYRAD